MGTLLFGESSRQGKDPTIPFALRAFCAIGACGFVGGMTHIRIQALSKGYVPHLCETPKGFFQFFVHLKGGEFG